MTDDDKLAEMERRVEGWLWFAGNWAIREAINGNWDKFDDIIERTSRPPWENQTDRWRKLAAFGRDA